MALPANFLATWNNTVATWGNPAKVFVHEWAKLRYGIFDEFGFSGNYPYNILFWLIMGYYFYLLIDNGIYFSVNRLKLRHIVDNVV